MTVLGLKEHNHYTLNYYTVHSVAHCYQLVMILMNCSAGCCHLILFISP